jgi:hypothetical protein
LTPAIVIPDNPDSTYKKINLESWNFTSIFF